ncbi:MAG: hypothetical protein ACJAWK_000899 [Candidatus Azotimanducaceae bacterium]|jgi:hypothetical protein
MTRIENNGAGNKTGIVIAVVAPSLHIDSAFCILAPSAKKTQRHNAQNNCQCRVQNGAKSLLRCRYCRIISTYAFSTVNFANFIIKIGFLAAIAIVLDQLT